jgi:hypothetical protein
MIQQDASMSESIRVADIFTVAAGREGVESAVGRAGPPIRFPCLTKVRGEGAPAPPLLLAPAYRPPRGKRCAPGRILATVLVVVQDTADAHRSDKGHQDGLYAGGGEADDREAVARTAPLHRGTKVSGRSRRRSAAGDLGIHRLVARAPPLRLTA